MQRHFCSTTYILDKNQPRILLHWHKKLQTWLPPGGHLEENESPYEAAVREIDEEYGPVGLRFIHPNNPRRLDERSRSLEMPHFLIEEDIEEGHIHLDWIFFAFLVDDEKLIDNEYRWFNREDLEKDDDCFSNVKELAYHAMDNFYN